METLLQVVSTFNQSNHFSQTLQLVLDICLQYPSGVTRTIIAIELQKSLYNYDSYNSFKVTSIEEHPSLCLVLDDGKNNERKMILHSKYFNLLPILNGSMIRFVGDCNRSLIMPVELFIVPSDDVSWYFFCYFRMFISFFEDIHVNSIQHNMLIKIMSIKEVKNRVEICVCDITGAKGFLNLNDNQCKYRQLFKVVYYFVKL
jgi:hypothetical protein